MMGVAARLRRMLAIGGYGALAAVSLLDPSLPAIAQEPPPQYSVEDIVGDFGCTPTGNDTACAPDNSIRSRTRAFSLSIPHGAVKPRPAMRDLLITFANGVAVLTPQGRSNAAVFAKALNTPQLAATRFVIEGHTNSVGNRSYNLGLSRLRAQAVADTLVGHGVARNRIRTEGYGFDRPIDRRDPTAAANRRVEARLVP